MKHFRGVWSIAGDQVSGVTVSAGRQTQDVYGSLAEVPGLCDVLGRRLEEQLGLYIRLECGVQGHVT